MENIKVAQISIKGDVSEEVLNGKSVLDGGPVFDNKPVLAVKAEVLLYVDQDGFVSGGIIDDIKATESAMTFLCDKLKD